MKPGLVCSKFFILTVYAVQFQTIGMSLSLTFANGSVKRISFTLDLFVLQELTVLAASSGSENLNKKFVFSLN